MVCLFVLDSWLNNGNNIGIWIFWETSRCKHPVNFFFISSLNSPAPKFVPSETAVIPTNCEALSIDDINTALSVYRTELTNIKGSLKKFDLAINKLVQSGWSGHSSYIFYSTRFSMFKASIASVESQLNYMVRYLEKAKNEVIKQKNESYNNGGALQGGIAYSCNFKENQAKKLAKKLVETAKELSIDSDEMLNLIKEEYEK